MLCQQRNSQLVVSTTAPKRFGGCLFQTGQGLTEYIAILALIAVAAIGSASYFGQVIRGMKAFVVNELAGAGNSSAALATAQAVAPCAQAETRVVTLGTYGSKDQPCVAPLTVAIPVPAPASPVIPVAAPAPPAPLPTRPTPSEPETSSCTDWSGIMYCSDRRGNQICYPKDTPQYWWFCGDGSSG